MDNDEVPDPSIVAMRQATLGLPPGSNLDVIYEVYKTSLETKLLKSEIGRHIYADALIDNPKLGPLSLLCVRALAMSSLPHAFLPLIADDPLKMRVYYDHLSIDLPLEIGHYIEDEEYWKRVVMAKSSGKCYAHSTLNWKNLGISLLLVERLESYPAELWQSDIKELAKQIKQYVTEMHIRRLQSMFETSFERHIKAALGELSGSDESTTSYLSSDSTSDLDKLSQVEREHKLADANRREARRAELEQKRKMRIERTVFRLTWRVSSASIIAAPIKPKPKPKKKKKKKKKKNEEETPPPSIFDIEIEPPQEDSMEKIVDHRNKAAYMRMLKAYTYPADHCHHLNLNFVRFFTNLVSFTLEFLGPKLNIREKYHQRHFNFSTRDIERLAYGIAFLHQLKVFRLRNSRMNAQKLNILTQALRDMDCIETIDFGYDHLVDDCGAALNNLFLNTPTIKSLELEGNLIGVESLQGLADGLSVYEGTLDYLGLAGTRLGDQALHVLNASIRGTEHIKQLCLVGATISQSAIICCIAQELIVGHPPLVHLDIGSIVIHLEAADRLLAALQLNIHLQYFNCRGCGLPPDMEIEAQILKKRNEFVLENPFIGDHTKTADEVNESITQTKDPLLLRALAAVEKRKQCYANQKVTVYQDPTATEEPAIEEPVMEEPEMEQQPTRSVSSVNVGNDLVSVDPLSLTEEQFKRLMAVPGPTNRYHYFRSHHRYGRSY